MIAVVFAIWVQAVAVTAGVLLTLIPVQGVAQQVRVRVLTPLRAAMRRPRADLTARASVQS